MTNEQIARRLRDYASELAQGGENLYRVRAYRQAAMAVLGLPGPVTSRAELANVPGIGASLAETIAEYAVHGVWNPRRQRPARRQPAATTRQTGVALSRGRRSSGVLRAEEWSSAC